MCMDMGWGAGVLIYKYLFCFRFTGFMACAFFVFFSGCMMCVLYHCFPFVSGCRICVLYKFMSFKVIIFHIVFAVPIYCIFACFKYVGCVLNKFMMFCLF